MLLLSPAAAAPTRDHFKWNKVCLLRPEYGCEGGAIHSESKSLILNRKVLLEIHISSTQTLLPVISGNPPLLKNKMHTGDFKVTLQIDFSYRGCPS